MNMLWQPHEISACNETIGRVSGEREEALYEVTMRIAVRDAGLLWRMAVARALTFMTVTDTETEEMLGPIEDPSVEDCIAMLVGPREIAGCSFERFAISPAMTG